MSGLERQLSEYSAREGEVERIAKDSKEKVEEALVLRDQALTREEQLRREIERLHDDRKKHALQKQNEIDSAVEVAKGVAGSQIRSLEHDIEELTARMAKTKGKSSCALSAAAMTGDVFMSCFLFVAEADKAVRDCKSAESLLEKTRQAISNDRKSSEAAMRRLEERIAEVIVEKEDAVMKTKAVYDLNTELRLTIDKLRTHVSRSSRYEIV
jgi:chromosome segregation ATPase